MARHFIITLFNLPLWDHDKHRRPTRSPHWLRERTRLFRQYCLPSVKAQECQEFDWLVLLDADSPQWLRQEMERCRQECPRLRPMYFTADECATFHDTDPARRCDFLRRAIRGMLRPGDDTLITTNLDNDDALHSQAVAAIQRNARVGSLVSLNRGLQYFAGMGVAVAMRYPHNHFLSFAEDVHSDFLTVEYLNHARAYRTMPVVDVARGPMWMEVVHGANVSNGLRLTSRIGYRPLLRGVDLRGFGLTERLGAARQLWGTLIRLPLLALPTAAGKLARKMRPRRDKPGARGI